MTITTQLPAPVLRSTDHVLSSLPYLLGFIPRDSAVLLWIHEGKLALTQRVDLPYVATQLESSEDLELWAQEVAQVSHQVSAQEVLIVVNRPDSALATTLCRSLIEQGVYPGAVWCLNEDRYCEFDFTQAQFSSTWIILSPQVSAEVVDDFVSAGWTFLNDRNALTDEVTEVRDVQHEVLTLLCGVELTDVNPADDAQRDQLIARIIAAIVDDEVDNTTVGLVCVALLDVCVRDCVLWQLSAESAQVSYAAKLREFVRAAPSGLRAPVATVAAIYAWMLGDGARANAALAQALLDDPTYGLALMMEIALSNGVAPRHWQAMMQELTYDAARWSGAPSERV